MRKKIALLSVLTTFTVALVATPGASASYLGVYVGAGVSYVCQPAPDAVNVRLTFKATVTAVGISKPKKIRIGFQVVNRETKRVLRSGVTNLKRSKGYKSQTPMFTAATDEKLAYHLNMSYQSGGKTRKKKSTLNDQIYSQSYLESVGLPVC